MVIKNGYVHINGAFTKTDLSINGGIIENIGETVSGGDYIDAEDCYVLPGFVDIHTHGAAGYDFSDADTVGFEKMIEYYLSVGTTSVVMTTMTYPEEILSKAIKTALSFFGGVLRGINLEGPFFSINKRGAQNAEYIMNPDFEMFKRLYNLSGGRILLCDIAPELPGAMRFIKNASKLTTVSLAHSEASYNIAAEAFEAGATHVTHLFNAMSPLTQREPGIVGAAGDFAKYIEILSDGIHLHPAIVRLVFKYFSAERVCIVSDSLQATGMPDGIYSLGGQQFRLTGETTALVNCGSLAGSVICLPDMCRRAVKFGIPLEDAVRACSENPARAVGIFGDTGSISKGKHADILIWNKDLTTRNVIYHGITTH